MKLPQYLRLHFLCAYIFLFSYYESIGQDLLPGWLNNGNPIDAYERSIHVIGGNRMVHIRAIPSKIEDIQRSAGGIIQNIKADAYRSKFIRLSARFKIKGVTNFFSLRLYVFGSIQGELLAYDNLWQRDIKGTRDWQGKHIILRIPEEAYFIQIGARVHGLGEAWIDDFQLEEVNPSLGVTDMIVTHAPRKPTVSKSWDLEEKLLTHPQNLDFEQ